MLKCVKILQLWVQLQSRKTHEPLKKRRRVIYSSSYPQEI